MKNGLPRVSVIVPTFQRPRPLAYCLDALARLDYPRDRLELIVVNDGGDLPDHVVREHADLPLRVLHQSNAGPASARNAGAARAAGDVLAFTDDDCRPAPGWLRHLVAALHDDPLCLAGGRTENILDRDLCAVASQLLIDFLYEHYRAPGGEPWFFASNNFAMHADTFRAMGGFDTSFPRAAGEDRDFCDHWRHRGGHLRFVPDALVHHAHHLSVRRFWRQHFAYGTGAWRFRAARAGRAPGHARVEPFAFYLRLLGYPLTKLPAPRAVPVVGLMLLSQVANAAGYAVERSRHGRRTSA